MFALLLCAGAASGANKIDWNECTAGKGSEAIAACTRIIEGPGETTKDRANAYFNRAGLREMENDPEGALADYGEAIRLDPKAANFYAVRGETLRRRGQFDNALADLDASLKLDPKLTLAYLNRGNVWRAKSEPDRAIADYNSAIRLDDKYAAAYFNRGGTFEDKGEHERAIADYGLALRHRPRYSRPTKAAAAPTCARRISTARSPISAKRS